MKRTTIIPVTGSESEPSANAPDCYDPFKPQFDAKHPPNGAARSQRPPSWPAVPCPILCSSFPQRTTSWSSRCKGTGYPRKCRLAGEWAKWQYPMHLSPPQKATLDCDALGWAPRRRWLLWCQRHPVLLCLSGTVPSSITGWIWMRSRWQTREQTYDSLESPRAVAHPSSSVGNARPTAPPISQDPSLCPREMQWPRKPMVVCANWHFSHFAKS